MVGGLRPRTLAASVDPVVVAGNPRCEDVRADLLEAIKIELTRQGFEVLTATDGAEALALALSERPALVLVDVMMPRLSGYHVAQELSSRLGPAAPPILVMTGRAPGKDAAIALLSGAARVLQKPFSMKLLREAVREALAGNPAAPPSAGTP